MTFPGTDVTIAAYLVKHPEILAQYEQDLEEYPFANKFILWVFLIIKEVWVENARKGFPSLTEALLLVEEKSADLPEVHRLHLTNACKKIYKTGTSSVTADKVVKYLMKRQSEFLQDALESMDPADLQTAEAQIHQLRVIRDSPYGVGSACKGPFEEDAVREMGLDDDSRADIPLGLPKTDALLGGGGRRGEVTLIQIPTNKGKTLVKMSLSRNMIMMGYRVLYIGLDNPEAELYLRMQECMLGATRSQFESRRDFVETFLGTFGNPEYWGNALQPEKHMIMRTRKDFRRRPSTNDIRAVLTSIEMNPELREYDTERGIPPEMVGKVDCIVVDYFRRMAPSFGMKNAALYERETVISEDCQELAIITNTHILGSTQVNRGGYNEREGDLTNTAGAFDKNFAAGLALVYQQSEEEENNDQFRLATGKLRRGVAPFEVKLQMDRRITRVWEVEHNPITFLSDKPKTDKSKKRKKKNYADNQQAIRDAQFAAAKQGLLPNPGLDFQ